MDLLLARNIYVFLLRLPLAELQERGISLVSHEGNGDRQNLLVEEELLRSRSISSTRPPLLSLPARAPVPFPQFFASACREKKGYEPTQLESTE